MQSLQKTHDILSHELEKVYKKPGKGSSGDLEYLKIGAVGLAMNEAFTPTGWDTTLNEIKIIKEAHKINGNGVEDVNGQYWNAIASAVVVVKARALQPNGTVVEAVRSGVGVGSAVGGRSKTMFDAIQNALTSAESMAIKRACKFFGPKTGATLAFDHNEKEIIERQIAEANNLRKEASDSVATQAIETSVPATNVTLTQPAPAAQPAAQVPDSAPLAAVFPAGKQTDRVAPATHTNGALPEVLTSFAGRDLIASIAALQGNDAAIPSSDLKGFHGALVKAFGPYPAMGLWRTAGVTLGPGVVVKRKDVFGVAQVIEEASAGKSGLQGFLSQFQTPDAKPATTQTPAVAATTTTPTIQASTVTGTSTPAVQTATATNGASPTFGQVVQEEFDATPSVVADRKKKYEKQFSGLAPELVDILASTPEKSEVTKEIAAKVHGAGLSILQRNNVPATDVFERWKNAGVELGKKQPTGKHLRAFADALPA